MIIVSHSQISTELKFDTSNFEPQEVFPAHWLPLQTPGIYSWAAYGERMIYLGSPAKKI